MQNDGEMRAGKRRRSLVEVEEERVWASLYRRTADPMIAAELVAHLEKSGELRFQHSGLYLRCKQVLRREKARQVRLRKIGAGIRWAFHMVIGAPLGFTGRLIRNMGAVILASLPEREDRAAAQLHRLKSGSASQVDAGEDVSPSEIVHPLREQAATESRHQANIGASQRSTRRAGGRAR
ncbi:hypothetical protein O0881_00120 [Janthinobacterium sp. SUN100]|uniref:hypothetical protein n=1 Tax=Janthinobacterium sp. SUN100 TaxID=3004101 RepID=UPI0025B13F5B|nr:hypothetical protein [Janthinobacterium sp. SUN100]MDN2700394.1 hypothetical protein [Janthinobacterium sp. SUN100]